MVAVETLRQQHDAASAMIERLLDHAVVFGRASDADQLALKLTRLVSLLRLHFLQEDETLYAPLLDSPDRDVAAVARDYFEELHGLSDTLDLFAFRWCSGDAIAANRGRFRLELQALCDALRRRIVLEEAYLYPLLDCSARLAA